MDEQVQKDKLFVGGLPWAVDNDALAQLFAKYGEIKEAVVITHRYTGRSKGFGFVTFANAEDAEKALEMDGQEVDGRNLTVNLARPEKKRDDARAGAPAAAAPAMGGDMAGDDSDMDMMSDDDEYDDEE